MPQARRVRPPPEPDHGGDSPARGFPGLAGALCGVVAALAMVLVWGLFRLGFAIASVPELLGDRVGERIPVRTFLDLIGRFGSYDRLKAFSVVGVVAGVVALGAVVGAIYARVSRRPPAADAGRSGLPRRAVLLLEATVVVAWLGSLVAFWPLLGTYYHGEDQATARAATAASLLAGYVTFAVVLMAAHQWVLRPRPAGHPGPGVGRRSLLAGGVGVGVALATAGVVTRLAERSTFGYDGQQVFGDLEPYTPNDRFYVVTQNLVDPDVRRSAWRLRIDGEVERPRTFDFAAISAMEAIDQDTTLTCISNGVGGGLISNAAWRGVRLRDLLAEAGPRTGAVDVVVRGVDGYTDTFPFAKAMEPTTLVAYEMNGEPLPRRHGFPARILVPGLYGEKNVKWVDTVTVSTSEEKGFYEHQGWGPDFTVETRSRFSAPDLSRPLVQAPVTLEGSAFAGDRGVSRVEVSVDDGSSWQPATLTFPGSRLTWSLWSFLWTPTEPGQYRLVVRAYDGTGTLQIADPRPVVPEGVTGYHRVTATVR